ncbi:MAG: single-stranded-DNA-specific exonuclease RecJ [Lachnospiraceae bacterium]|nr:single-stranded-DNA-specific exonuclease RecJ [Lachnospiraceae bacterium]
MERWVLLHKGADFDALSEKFHISRRLVSLIRNRNVIGEKAVEQYLHGTILDLHDGMLLKDADKAVDLLKEKIAEQKKIRVIGDYDIDGVNATYILLEGLEGLGADVDYDIPNRMTDGYGISEELIERAAEAKVDTIITCDNGIAAKKEIAYAKELGMTVIVTDHHEVPYEETEDAENKRTYILPPANAVIDPKQPDCNYPFEGICGATVAYKLMEALYESSGRDADDIDYLIENVALATIGDVMDLEDENRILVKEGLEMLKRTSNPGLRSLMECTGINKESLSPYHVGFVIGPCLNAGGRLDTAKRALELLRAKDKKDADILAGDLKALNDSRKELTAKAVKEAVACVENENMKKDPVLVIYLPDCHESLAGIVAGKVREKYYKPVFVITDAKEGAKGSGRSIEAYHMYENLHNCDNLLDKYGGHKMAAGLSLPVENIDKLRKRLNEQCTLTAEELTEKVTIDMVLPFSEITFDFIEELKMLEPFGKGNTKPVFAERNLKIQRARVLGRERNVLKLHLEDVSKHTMEAIYFGDVEQFFDFLRSKYGNQEVEALLAGSRSNMTIYATYYPEINSYMGRKTLQIVMTHYQ